MKVWREGQEKKTTQLIFCDLSTPKGDGQFNIYDDLREKLTEQGVSLRAAGWTCDGRAGGKNWTGKRFRPDETNTVMKIRFSRHAVPTAMPREQQ